MTKEKIIYQLESLKYFCGEMNKDAINNMWKYNIKALEIAIEIIKESEEKE